MQYKHLPARLKVLSATERPRQLPDSEVFGVTTSQDSVNHYSQSLSALRTSSLHNPSSLVVQYLSASAPPPSRSDGMSDILQEIQVN